MRPEPLVGRDAVAVDDQLAVALRTQLRALTAELEPSASLLAAIEAIGQGAGATRAERLHRRLTHQRRRFLIAVPLPLIGVFTGASMLFTGATVGPTAAFALLGNGSVRVSIEQLIGVRAANAQLRHLGVSSIVVVPMTAACQLHPSVTYLIPARLHPAPKITLTPHTIAPGATVVLAAAKLGHNLVQMVAGRFRRDHIPRCVSLFAPPPGVGTLRPMGSQYAPLIRELTAAAAAVLTGHGGG